jgi:DNA-binding PucR family transcriptional regulator
MLLRCCGEFSTEMMVPPELVRLYRRSSTDVDYIETLRTFLDNDCRITRTANVLYLHRTTMVKRLEKMREHVNLDDPDRRLYLRMCLHLPDIEQTLEACSDVS